MEDRTIECPKCGEKIDKTEPLEIRGTATVRGTESLSGFATHGVMWEPHDSWNEEAKCPNCHRFFALSHFSYEELELRIEDEEKAKVTFHPQAWQNDYAVPVDPEGETEFIVPLSDATDEDGNLLEDNTHESDALKYHGNAPKWIREWNGPFYITIEKLT